MNSWYLFDETNECIISDQVYRFQFGDMDMIVLAEKIESLCQSGVSATAID